MAEVIFYVTSHPRPHEVSQFLFSLRTLPHMKKPMLSLLAKTWFHWQPASTTRSIIKVIVDYLAPIICQNTKKSFMSLGRPAEEQPSWTQHKMTHWIMRNKAAWFYVNMLGRIMVPQRCLCPTTLICEGYLRTKGTLLVWLRIFRGEIILDYLDGPRCNHNGPYKRQGGRRSESGKKLIEK